MSLTNKGSTRPRPGASHRIGHDETGKGLSSPRFRPRRPAIGRSAMTVDEPARPGAGRPFASTSLRRKGSRDRVALITWPRASDAKIGCRIALEWDLVKRAHPKVVPVAVVGFALAQALVENPITNRRVALWRIHPHKTVRLSFAIDSGDSLKIAVVDHADTLNSREFQRALRVSVREARRGVGPLARATRLFEHAPVGLGRPVLRLWSLLSAGLGLALFGLPAAPFGAALISSVERFKLPAADAPFIPFTRCALVCSVGAITPSVVARDGFAVVVDVVEVSVTFDHRVSDGSQLAAMLQSFHNACYGVAPSQP